MKPTHFRLPVGFLLLLLSGPFLFAQIKGDPKNAASTQQLTSALDSFTHILHGWQAEISAGSLDNTDDFRAAYSSVSAIKDAAIAGKQYLLTVRAARLMAESLDSLLSFDLRVLDTLLKNYGELSKWSLYARDFAGAEQAALRALNLAKNPLEHSPLDDLPPSPEKDALLGMFSTPDDNWLRPNLGHSYLLRGDWEKARKIYEQYIIEEKDSDQAKKALLKDLDELKAAGIGGRAVKKAKMWLVK